MTTYDLLAAMSRHITEWQNEPEGVRSPDQVAGELRTMLQGSEDGYPAPTGLITGVRRTGQVAKGGYPRLYAVEVMLTEGEALRMGLSEVVELHVGDPDALWTY